MIGINSIITLSFLLALALAGGMVAHRLKQPIILGYLIIGILAGPFTLGWIRDTQMIEAAASLGVTLLMFTVGLEISITQLIETGKVGIWGGLMQIIFTTIAGTIAGMLLFSWPLQQSILFGLIISLSSTAICLKILMERGELGSPHGRIMISFLILQDICVVAMMVILPIMGNSGENIFMSLGLALGKSFLFIGAILVLGQWVLPWLLGDIGGIRSRELFLLTILVICLGATVGTQILGLSMVFGAFLIGLILRSTRFAHQALAEITPLRDIFATLFFVSVGMLLNPYTFISNWQIIISIVLVIIFVKITTVFLIVKGFGYNNRIALFTGTGLFQVGEFGFVLAAGALSEGIFTPQIYSYVLTATIISMILTPFAISAITGLYPRVSAGIDRRKIRKTLIYEAQDTGLTGDTGPIIIAGYGRVGQNICNGLDQAGLPYIIIDIDPECLNEAKKYHKDHIYGDASNPFVLHQANVGKASALVITYPDPIAVAATVKNARIINPGIKILARYHKKSEAENLKRLGVDELINPEYEAGFKFYKQLLKITGFNKGDRTHLVDLHRKTDDTAESSNNTKNRPE